MTAVFRFDPTSSDKANAFLKARAEHLKTLSPSGRAVFIKSALVSARQLPLSSTENAFVKAEVILTLQRWLDDVREAA